jgi:hypothetical protein
VIKEDKPKDKSIYSILYLLIPVIGVVFTDDKHLTNKPLMIILYFYHLVVGGLLGYLYILYIL